MCVSLFFVSYILSLVFYLCCPHTPENYNYLECDLVLEFTQFCVAANYWNIRPLKCSCIMFYMPDVRLKARVCK